MNSFDLEGAIFNECADNNFPNDLKIIFKAIKENNLINKYISKYINHHQNTGNELIYDLILYAYRKAGMSFSPHFKFNVNDSLFNRSLPKLCLSLHSNFSPLTSILLERHCPFVVVSDYPDTVRQIALNSGIRSGNIKIINRDASCLINSKKFLQLNYAISSTIDFRDEERRSYNLLSDSMLKLALIVRPITLFGLSSVNDSGEMVYSTHDIDLNDSLEQIKIKLLGLITSRKANSKYRFEKFNFHEQKPVPHIRPLKDL